MQCNTLPTSSPLTFDCYSQLQFHSSLHCSEILIISHLPYFHSKPARHLSIFKAPRSHWSSSHRGKGHLPQEEFTPQILSLSFLISCHLSTPNISLFSSEIPTQLPRLGKLLESLSLKQRSPHQTLNLCQLHHGFRFRVSLEIYIFFPQSS
jgi:hypothetical protein